MGFSDFLCCLRRKDQQGGEQPDVVDEHTHLIPTTEDQPAPSSTLSFVDPAQLRERLGTIVRAKEGRMVNVVPSYNSRDHSTNPKFNQPDFSRMSSTISSLRARSISTSESATLPAQESMRASQMDVESEDDPRDSNDPPKIVVSSPRKIIPRPAIPAFDDPNIKLSLSWGD